MNDLLEKQMPPKSFYVLGTNWYCYVEPSESDLEFLLKAEDFYIEICTKAIEAFFGERENDTLTVIDKEREPMIGVLLAICNKGDEENEDNFQYQPSYLSLGNCAKYKSSHNAMKAYVEFRKDVEEALKKKSKPDKKKISKKPPQPPPSPEI